jgi:hypothetical protein
VRLKYIKNHPICLIPSRMDDSPLWKDMMKVRHIYLQGREYQIHNGKSVSFWLEKWLGDKPLCLECPILYNVCTHKDSSVHDVAEAEWVVEFKFRLQGLLRDQWHNLAARLNMVSLDHEKDMAIWKWNMSKKISVKSVYTSLTRNEVGKSYSRVWKARLPEKIKIFMWLVEQKAILTKENMIKRNRVGDPRCYFCGLPETCDHLLFECPIARVVWG